MGRAGGRVLFVGHTAAIGGPTYSLLMLVRYLKERYRIAVLLPEEGSLSEMLADEGVPAFVIPRLHARTIPRIFQLIRRERFDLVYGNNPSARSRNAMLAAKLARKPFVWHFRSILTPWQWNRAAVFLPLADEVVAVSKACAASLACYHPRKAVNVVYNGVELPAFDHDRQCSRTALAAALGLPPDARYLLSVGSVTPRKAQDQAVAVMARVVQEMPDTHLLIAGRLDHDLSYTNDLRRSIERWGLADRVHLLGLRTDVAHLLAAADIFLHTARQDPHPRAVIEAMAAGLPVVATGVDGVAETVVEGDTGCLVAPGEVSGMAEAVLALLRAPAQAGEMGRRGRERVQTHFSAARTADQISQIIARLL